MAPTKNIGKCGVWLHDHIGNIDTVRHTTSTWLWSTINWTDIYFDVMRKYIFGIATCGWVRCNTALALVGPLGTSLDLGHKISQPWADGMLRYHTTKITNVRCIVQYKTPASVLYALCAVSGRCRQRTADRGHLMPVVGIGCLAS
jgi:hypothetical protein